MLKAAIAVDATIAASVQQTGLPADLILQPIDFAADGLPAAPDGGLLLGIVLPLATRADIERIRGVLPDYLRSDGIFFVSDASPTSLPDWCWQRLCRVSEHLAREYARSHLALAGYRERERQLERSLEMAEAACVDFRKEPLKLALRVAPVGVFAHPGAAPSGRPNSELVVRQLVPQSLANVVYIDLYFSRDGSSLTGEGRLFVIAEPSGRTLCDAVFPLTDIRPGWKRFACAADDGAARETLRLELSLVAAEPLDLLPGLGAPTPLAEESAVIVGGAPAGRPVAMQVWCGIAGLRYPRHVAALPPPGRAATALETLSVPAELMATLVPFSAAGPDLGFAPVSYEAASQSMLVHPLGSSATVARLPALPVSRLKSVSALVQLRRVDAPPTEFAILAMSAASRPPRLQDLNDRTGPLGASLKWLPLLGGEWGEVTCDLAEPLSDQVDIYLMTRNRTDDYNFSWAFFRGLQLVCERAGTS
jgi:hypothetical protein